MDQVTGLKNIADDVRTLYRVDHVLTLGDIESLTQRRGAKPHVVDEVISAMTTWGSAPGSRVLRPEYLAPDAYPSVDES